MMVLHVSIKTIVGIISFQLLWHEDERREFLEGSGLLSDLKLRLGYITGQQTRDGDYPYMARYMYSKAGVNYYFGNNKYSLIALKLMMKLEMGRNYNLQYWIGFQYIEQQIDRYS